MVRHGARGYSTVGILVDLDDLGAVRDAVDALRIMEGQEDFAMGEKAFDGSFPLPGMDGVAPTVVQLVARVPILGGGGRILDTESSGSGWVSY